MRNKLTFILPRVAVITLAAGLAALVLFVVFKLLLVFLAVAVIALAVKAIAGAIRQDRYGYEDESFPVPSGITPMQESETIVPVTFRPKQTIVPIS